jgi:pyruvate,water dikinase
LYSIIHSLQRVGLNIFCLAPARVILSLDEAHQVRKGEVLVTQYTSPGWTPLFSVISALITEIGGLLSHGAVVARECKIPAVLQVSHATEFIHTGDLIEVDGSSGTITFIKRSGEN